MYNIRECYIIKIGGVDMDYLTVKEMGEKWGISGRRVTYYIENGRIKGVIKKGYMWLVPADAEKPLDRRYKNNKKKEGERNV
jgi:hypothetical protein